MRLGLSRTNVSWEVTLFILLAIAGRSVTMPRTMHCQLALTMRFCRLGTAPLQFKFAVMPRNILSTQELLEERARLRNAGRKLVFTNGVFDILHVGHVRYLQQARELGDALVVAINSDAAARALKGAGRPLTNENDRAEILAALACIDYVTIFDELSPRSLIAELLPEVLVKGGDYTLDQIHGREEVEAAGGRVVSLPFVEGASTSAIVERVRSL